MQDVGSETVRRALGDPRRLELQLQRVVRQHATMAGEGRVDGRAMEGCREGKGVGFKEEWIE